MGGPRWELGGLWIGVSREGLDGSQEGLKSEGPGRVMDQGSREGLGGNWEGLRVS